MWRKKVGQSVVRDLTNCAKFAQTKCSVLWERKLINLVRALTHRLGWVITFYSNASSTIQNNGWSSEFFLLSRGVRQGCPLSPYLFILCIEVLDSATRKELSIRGINVLGVECKTGQYSDDITLILDESAFQYTKDTNLLSFQFKFPHRIIATNDFLNKIGVSSCTMCTFCNECVATLEHVFWECRFLQSFWKIVTEWL